MEHKNGSSSSEHPNLPIDEDSLDNEKTVARRSSSSFSSSTSFSSLNHFEVDIGENDTKFPELEVNDTNSMKLNAESPSKSPKLSMISTTPQAGGLTSADLNMFNGSPKQSPPIQVMGYDDNRILSSKFPLKRRNDSEWSLASNESLFSIHMGNNSFSMDNGYFISKSGKLDWIDDGLEYSPGLSTVMDTSAENKRNSEEKEGILETQNDTKREKEWDGVHSFSTNSSVPNGKGASPTLDSANIACLSDASCQSTSSFAFPVYVF